MTCFRYLNSNIHYLKRGRASGQGENRCRVKSRKNYTEKFSRKLKDKIYKMIIKLVHLYCVETVALKKCKAKTRDERYAIF